MHAGIRKIGNTVQAFLEKHFGEILLVCCFLYSFKVIHMPIDIHDVTQKAMDVLNNIPLLFYTMNSIATVIENSDCVFRP